MTSDDGARILIIDDDEGVARLQQKRLTRAGHHVTVAGTAEAALEAVGRDNLELMLVDYRLAGVKTGLDFYQDVRAAGLDVPTILVTGWSNESIVIQALRAGVRDFVTKSAEYLEYLPDAVARVLKLVRMERRLADSEARLSGILESALGAVLTIDADLCITFLNSAAEEMFGRRAPDALGLHIGQMIPVLQEPAAPGDLAHWEQLAREAPETSFSSQTQGRRPNGELFPLEIEVSPGIGPQKRFYTLIARDLTDRNRLEEQLRQSQKMEAVGRLAGGIAHDFNNLLTVIIGYAEAIRDNVSQTSQAFSDAGIICRAAQQSAALTHQLLAFSRKLPLRPQLIELNASLQQVEKMLGRVIGADIELATRLTPESTGINADPAQIEQVLMNLTLNARDALPQGGTITFETAVAEVAAGSIEERQGLLPGDYVRLQVSDNGIGMSERVLEQVFEPFFTTKPEGEGTGLGLATVYGIIKQSGGHISVTSRQGEGTTFVIHFPAAAVPADIARPHWGASPVCGSETVLLVEDKSEIRTLVRKMLERHGYRVLEAEDGEAALALGRGHAPEIDLLLTDVVMPRMSGRQLAERLANEVPDLVSVYMSGYAGDVLTERGILPHSVTVLQKPFGERQLLAAVRHALELVREPNGDPCN